MYTPKVNCISINCFIKSYSASVLEYFPFSPAGREVLYNSRCLFELWTWDIGEEVPSQCGSEGLCAESGGGSEEGRSSRRRGPFSLALALPASPGHNSYPLRALCEAQWRGNHRMLQRAEKCFCNPSASEGLSWGRALWPY